MGCFGGVLTPLLEAHGEEIGVGNVIGRPGDNNPYNALFEEST